MAELSDRDRITWHRLAGRVAAIVEPRLSPSVLANRAMGPWPSWRTRPLRPSLLAARRLAGALPGPLVLRTDVAEFYPCVRPEVLFGALRRLGVASDTAGAAADLLDGWGSEGYAGLPIGPPGAAVMANAMLASVDHVLDGRPFLRWVDDYLISVRSERRAAEVVERLLGPLDRLGLRLASAKTALLEAGPSLRWLGGSRG